MLCIVRHSILISNYGSFMWVGLFTIETFDLVYDAVEVSGSRKKRSTFTGVVDAKIELAILLDLEVWKWHLAHASDDSSAAMAEIVTYFSHIFRSVSIEKIHFMTL